MPPNSSGHILLQELNMVEIFDLPAFGLNTAKSVHLMVEAKKRAFADREQYVADPDWMDIPLDGLLSKEYAHPAHARRSTRSARRRTCPQANRRSSATRPASAPPTARVTQYAYCRASSR